MTQHLVLIALATLFVVSIPGASAQQRTPRSSVPPQQVAATAKGGSLEYIDGIEALEAGNYPAAIASFSRAIEADDGNPEYHLARGVANALSEQFAAAVTDLERALKLRPAHRETRLWLLSAHEMANDEVFRNPKTTRPCFVHGGEVPPSYAEVVCDRMAGEYWSSRYRGMYFDREARRSVKVSAPVKTHFRDAAREFAARHKAAADVAGEVLLARMKASYERGDYAAAMKDLVSLRRSSPDDVQLRAYWALCLVAMGDVLHARSEFTRTLSAGPFWADGYVGRAEAAATLGDERRATADLQVASALHARSLDARRQRIAGLVQASPPGDAVERFTRGVSADAPSSVLVDAALAVHRWSNAGRDRYDEAYQDRIRVLHEAVRDDAKNTDSYELLARFLYQHRDVPTVWNGPRGGGEQVRPQSPAERQYELTHALELINDGLKVNGRHANGMATKALILVALNRAGDAGRVIDEGLAVDPKNIRLLRLKAQSLAAAAGSLALQASSLRAGSTDTYRERRSDGEYEVTRQNPPSAAELRQATLLEAQAAALQQQANQLAHEAKRVESDVIPALVRDGDGKLAGGDATGALRAWQQAYGYDPDTPGLMAHLAEAFKRLGDTRKEQVYALIAAPMRHTTAADALKTAWQETTRTAWRSAAEALDRAAATDAADARVAAYRSVVAAGVGDAPEAQRQRLAALALEEARARLMGTTFLGDRGGPLAVDDVGLTLILRLGQGRVFLAAGQADRAADAFAANVALEARLGKDHLVDLVPTGILPDPSTPPGRVSEAPSVASLIAWSRLESARALFAAGRPADAKREYLAVRAYEGNWPSTAKGRETLYVVDSWARLGLAEVAVAARDYDEAFRLLMSEGFPGRLPPEFAARRKALTDTVLAARKRQDALGPLKPFDNLLRQLSPK